MSLPSQIYYKVDTEINYDTIFKHIFSDSELGLIVLDSNNRVISWNPWFDKHCNIELNEALGRPLIEIFPILEKSSVQRGVRLAIEKGMSSVVSHTLNHKPFPLTNNSSQVIQQQILIKRILLEKPTTILFNSDKRCEYRSQSRKKQLIEQANRTRAVSEKLAREKERVQVTLDSIADAVISTDEQGKILFMNSVAEMLTGVLEIDAQHIKVDRVFKLIHEGSHDVVPCPVKQCLKSKDTIANEYEHVLIGKSGQFSITDSVAPIFDDDRQLLGYRSSF